MRLGEYESMAAPTPPGPLADSSERPISLYSVIGMLLDNRSQPPILSRFVQRVDGEAQLLVGHLFDAERSA